MLDNGTYHLTGSSAGTITAVAGDVTYTGHFAQEVGENGNLMNYEETVTFTLHLRGTDGSRITFTEVFHFDHPNGRRNQLISRSATKRIEGGALSWRSAPFKSG